MLVQSKKLILLVVLLDLAACATRTPVPESESEKVAHWEQHLARHNEISDWMFRGRIAIKLEKESMSASLHWRQVRQDYNLRLIAPLGRGTVELKGNEEGVSLKTVENKIIKAETPESLMKENLGWYVPVSGLSYWLRGLPQPDVALESLSLDEQGRLSELRQAGWQLTYRAYLGQDGYELPSKLSLENSKLRVHFSIKQWDIPQ